MATVASALSPNPWRGSTRLGREPKCNCNTRYVKESQAWNKGSRRRMYVVEASATLGNDNAGEDYYFSQDPSSWLAALEGLECQRRVDEGPESYWHPLKYKAPWVHADERQARVNQTTWRRKEPVLATISGYPLGYAQTSINPPVASSYEQYQQVDGHDLHAPEPSAVSQIAENLRRIRGPKKETETEEEMSRSRIGSLMQRMSSTLEKEEEEEDGKSTHQVGKVKSSAAPKFPWEMDDFPELLTEKKEPRIRPPSLAELTLPDAELKRLRSMIATTKDRIKLKKLGVTRGVLQAIHQRWKNSEIVKLKCTEEVALNMRRTREELERKTGGLVIWHAGGGFVIYRGKDYAGPPTLALPREKREKRILPGRSSISGEYTGVDKHFKEFVDHVPFIETEYELRMDRLLAEVGPRYADWTGPRPVPVDGDKLPQIDHTFKSPYRLLPYGVEENLSNREFTNLARLARQMPPQFVVSRSQGLQGLAKAMVKLWERTEVTKVAIKPSVQNVNDAKIADELKRLTGCVLLGRNKDYIIFYRGKDFLPAPIAAAFEEREAMSFANEDAEDKARMLPTGKVTENIVPRRQETEADIKLKEWLKSQEEEKQRARAMKAVRAARARRIEKRLNIANAKKSRAEKSLLKVEALIERREPPADRETITEEERFTLRRLGLKMHAFLLLGRRGVYSGVVENMHLHWKYRDLVKVIYKGKDRVDIQDTAKMLEYESGGILVDIVPTTKGQAFIYYRGKNYQRPEELRPANLLTRRRALQRYTDTQRRESLSRHILSLEHDIEKLGFMLEKMKGDGDLSDSDSESESESAVVSLVQVQPAEATETEEVYSEPEPVKPKRRPRTELGPILRAEPLTNRERLILRKQALQMKKPAHFHVGKCNLVGGVIRAIRLFLRKQALVKIGIKGRAIGTSSQELIKLIEDGTGAAFVCHELHKLIFYRGWPEGTKHPAYMEEELSYELINAVKEEDEMDFSFAGSALIAKNQQKTGTTLFLKGGESSGTGVDNLSHDSTGDGEGSDEQTLNDKEDYSEALSNVDEVEADFGNSDNHHAEGLAASGGYRSSDDDSGYSTGEETDDEAWNM